MSQSIGFLCYHRHVMVNDAFELPLVESKANDLRLRERCQGYTAIARSLASSDEQLDGYQLVPIRELLPVWPEQQFHQLTEAIQLIEWHNNHHFCSRCGTPTQLHQRDYATICPSCDYHQYPRVQPCIITAITRGDEILLARSVAHAQSNFYSLIAGFVEVGETLEQAVQRECLEEVGLKIHQLQYLTSQPWPFPTNLMIGFKAEYHSGELKLQEDEILEAAFFPFDQLPTIPIQGTIAHWMIQHIIQQSHI